jgi:hypothetical protein
LDIRHRPKHYGQCLLGHSRGGWFRGQNNNSWNHFNILQEIRFNSYIAMSYSGTFEKLIETLGKESVKFFVMIGLIGAAMWWAWGKMEGKDLELRRAIERHQEENKEEIKQLRVKVEQCNTYTIEVLRATVDLNSRHMDNHTKALNRILRRQGIDTVDE